MMLKDYQWLFLILLLGTLLRIFSLEETGLWMDEIHSSIGADPEKTIGEVIEYCKQDQPPLFFLLIHKWFLVFGYTDLVGRLFAVITGVLGIISIYFVGVEFKNSELGLVSSFITAINYFHIDYSRQIRFYPLVFLFASLSYLFFLRILKNKKPLDFFLYSLFTGALLNTHYFGMVVFVSQLIMFITILVINKITDLKFILWALLSGAFAGLSFLHWVPVVLSDLQISSYHLPQIEWYFPLQYYYVYFRDVVTCAVLGILSLFAIHEMIPVLKMKPLKLEYFVLLSWLLLSFLLPLLYSLYKIPMLEYKYTFIAVPAVFLLAALGINSESLNKIQFRVKPKMKIYIYIILFGAFMINVFFIKTLYYNRHPWQSWREVSQLIMRSDSKDQIVLSNFTWYFRYYFKIYKATSLIVEPRYIDKERLTESASIWVITSTLFPDSGPEVDQQKTISKKFVFEKELFFEDFNVKHYTKK